MKNKKRMAAVFLVVLLLMNLMVLSVGRSGERSKQIDEVWDRINGKLGLGGDAANKVWSSGAGWTSPSSTGGIGGQTGTTDLCNAKAAKLVNAANAIKSQSEWGVFNSKCPRIGCCGSYVWNVFYYAIQNYGLDVNWALTPCESEGIEYVCWDPTYIKNYQLFSKADIEKPGFEFRPGDILYYKDLESKCSCEDASHIQIIGSKRADGKHYLIDFASRARGVHSLSWEEYYAQQKFGNCGVREAVTSVYRAIPQCK